MSQDKPKSRIGESQQFEEPPASKVRPPTPDTDNAALSSFEPPREGLFEQAAVDVEARGITGFDARLLSIKRAIEEQLAGNVARGAVQAEGAHEGARNIVDVALGVAGLETKISSAAPGEASLTLM
jgi:hypothetical protein